MGGGAESTVFLLSSHGLFLSAEPSGRVVADKEEPKEWETWHMTRSDQRATLMSAHGKYLCAEVPPLFVLLFYYYYIIYLLYN